MKCLEVKVNENASTLIKKLLVDIADERWVWFSGSGESYYDSWNNVKLFEFGKPMTTPFLIERLHEKALIIFLNLKAFKEAEELPQIVTTEQFIETNCQCSIGVIDSYYIAIFMKDEQLLNLMHERATSMDVEYARIIDYETKAGEEYTLFQPW